MLTKLTFLIIFQYVHISNHYDVHLKLIQYYISTKLEIININIRYQKKLILSENTRTETLRIILTIYLGIS